MQFCNGYLDLVLLVFCACAVTCDIALVHTKAAARLPVQGGSNPLWLLHVAAAM